MTFGGKRGSEHATKDTTPLSERAVGVFLFEGKEGKDFSALDTTDSAYFPESEYLTRVCFVGVERNGYTELGIVSGLAPQTYVSEERRFSGELEAVREATMEMTHVRTAPNSELPFSGTSMVRKQATERPVLLYSAMVLPGEVGYSLDNDKHPVDRFINLSPEETEALLSRGSLVHGGKNLQLSPELQSLSLDDKQQVLSHAMLVETEKRLEVLMVLAGKSIPIKIINLQKLVVEIRGEIRNAHIRQAKKTTEKGMVPENFQTAILSISTQVDTLWEKILKGKKTTDTLKALDQSNIERIVAQVRPPIHTKDLRGLPAVDLLFPLLLQNGEHEKRLSHGELRVLAKDRELQRLIHMASALNRCARLPVDFSLHDVLKKLEKHKDGITLLSLSPAEIVEISREVDTYLHSMTIEAGIDENPLDQMDILRTPENMEDIDAYTTKLVRLATGHTLYPGSDASRVRFEAKRKMVLMYMLATVKEEHTRVVKKGVEQLDIVERSAFGFTADDDGTREYGEVVFDTHHTPLVRVTHEKSQLSMLRKTMSVDSGVVPGKFSDLSRDIYREAYVVGYDDGGQIADLLQPVSSPAEDFGGRLIYAFNEKNPTMPRVAYETIHALLDHAVKQKKDIRIENVKLLPGPDGKLRSSGPGGGDKIRMMKWDIVELEEGNVVACREVQLFLPQYISDAEGKLVPVTGEHDYQDKKEKDRRYMIERLFRTNTFRSVMEALYPARVYGTEVHKLSVGRKNGGVDKKVD